MIAFSVIDTGIGMTEEQTSILFHARSGNDNDDDGRHNPATGPKLGLAITQRLATLMGGSITVESKPGKGSSFTLTVPREAPRTLPTEDILPLIEKHPVSSTAPARRR